MRTLLIIICFVFTIPLTSCATRINNSPTKVTVVKRPSNYKIVNLKGNRYYVWNGRYHKKTRRGYVVVRI